MQLYMYIIPQRQVVQCHRGSVFMGRSEASRVEYTTTNTHIEEPEVEVTGNQTI